MLKNNIKAPDFDLKDLEGNRWSNTEMLGKKYMLSFYRYASCPFCNLRISFLIGLHEELELENQFLAVFQSDEADMKKHVANQEMTFPLCSDYKQEYYKVYKVNASIWAYIKGALKLTTLLKAHKSGFKISNPMGPKTTVPADFLIDEEGIIRHVFYGKDISDHLDLDVVEAFFKE